MAILTELEAIKRVLRESKCIAVLGVSKKEARAAFFVPRYLSMNGFDVFGVNPVLEGEVLFGHEVVGSLAGLDQSVDVVDVFRRSEHLEAHVGEILTMKPLPKVLWFQSGIKNDRVAKQLSEAGIDVVQNRCMLADHQFLMHD